MHPSHEIVAAKLDEIVEEMKHVGMWQAQPPPPEAMEFVEPFAMDTLAFEQWLQFVFIERVRSIIETQGSFPSSSQVADQAFREWKMSGSRADADSLIDRLREFDALFQS